MRTVCGGGGGGGGGGFGERVPYSLGLANYRRKTTAKIRSCLASGNQNGAIRFQDIPSVNKKQDTCINLKLKMSYVLAFH